MGYPINVGAHATCAKGGTLDLENVVRHLPTRDAFLRWMYTSRGVSLKASTNCCGEYLANAIAQRSQA